MESRISSAVWRRKDGQDSCMSHWKDGFHSQKLCLQVWLSQCFCVLLSRPKVESTFYNVKVFTLVCDLTLRVILSFNLTRNSECCFPSCMRNSLNLNSRQNYKFFLSLGPVSFVWGIIFQLSDFKLCNLKYCKWREMVSFSIISYFSVALIAEFHVILI